MTLGRFMDAQNYTNLCPKVFVAVSSENEEEIVVF